MKISIAQAVDLLVSGQIVGVPTDTVYGLAASLDHPGALTRIFTLKQRPQDKPLVVQIATIQQLDNLIKNIPASFDKLKKFWPGPLTMVFDANVNTVPNAIRSGQTTVAIRIAKHNLLLDLIKKTGPLAIPSANPSDLAAAKTAQEVLQYFGDDFPVLDGGPCVHGTESTIIRLTRDGFALLRKGVISELEIQQAIDN